MISVGLAFFLIFILFTADAEMPNSLAVSANEKPNFAFSFMPVHDFSINPFFGIVVKDTALTDVLFDLIALSINAVLVQPVVAPARGMQFGRLATS